MEKRVKDITVILSFLFCLNLLSQTLQVSEIKKLSETINNEMKGVIIDPSSGLKGRGVSSIGRKIIFQYDVPNNWFPFDDQKKRITNNLIETGNSKMWVKGKVDLGYLYFKNDELIYSTYIDWEELGFKLGDYLDLTNHPKSNGLEFKLKKPLGWEVKEGDGPHIVKKFTSDKKVYMIYVKETGQFFTKEEVRELFQNEKDRKEFLIEFGKGGGMNFKTNKVVTIETYPFLYTNGIIQQERMGIEIKGKIHIWMGFIEDQFIYFMGSNYSEEEDFYIEFFKITNSIKLLTQYN